MHQHCPAARALTARGSGRRYADPFPKPSYLFALVAGDLGSIESSFTTRQLLPPFPPPPHPHEPQLSAPWIARGCGAGR